MFLSKILFLNSSTFSNLKISNKTSYNEIITKNFIHKTILFKNSNINLTFKRSVSSGNVFVDLFFAVTEIVWNTYHSPYFNKGQVVEDLVDTNLDVSSSTSTSTNKEKNPNKVVSSNEQEPVKIKAINLKKSSIKKSLEFSRNIKNILKTQLNDGYVSDDSIIPTNFLQSNAFMKVQSMLISNEITYDFSKNELFLKTLVIDQQLMDIFFCDIFPLIFEDEPQKLKDNFFGILFWKTQDVNKIIAFINELKDFYIYTNPLNPINLENDLFLKINLNSKLFFDIFSKNDDTVNNKALLEEKLIKINIALRPYCYKDKE